MPSIPWSTHINFASALLLHSCITILLKESLNVLEITRRLVIRHRKAQQNSEEHSLTCVTKGSAVLDAYTSTLSADNDGELAELYFTNTGFALLAVSLASSVAMNLLLSDLALNMIVAGTFALTFTVSLTVVGNAKYTLPLMALRRAGRFIWSDTPFINFFSLIYIATALKGQSNLRLRDYVTFRGIAVLELVFMKARLASADVETQITLMRKLIATERVVLHAAQKSQIPSHDTTILSQKDIQAFNTSQRLFVMLCKTSIGHEFGCVAGELGASRLPLPAVKFAVEALEQGWKLCRLSEDIMILLDCLPESKPQGILSRIEMHMHGMLLKRLRKKRVIYLLRQSKESDAQKSIWHSNVNLVTGVSMDWLDIEFGSGQEERSCERDCVVAGKM